MTTGLIILVILQFIYHHRVVWDYERRIDEWVAWQNKKYQDDWKSKNN